MTKCAQHFLIVSLAVFDLISGTVVMPTEIVDMEQYYMFESIIACKMLRFVNACTNNSSILMLLVIAADRYKNVVQPLHPQKTIHSARLSLLLVTVASLLFSWPALILFGIRSVDVGIPNVRGKDCTIDDSYQGTAFPLVYNGLQFASFTAVSASLVVIYVRIFKETRRHFKYIKKTTDIHCKSDCFAKSHSNASISLISKSQICLDDHYIEEHSKHIITPLSTSAATIYPESSLEQTMYLATDVCIYAKTASDSEISIEQSKHTATTECTNATAAAEPESSWQNYIMTTTTSTKWPMLSHPIRSDSLNCDKSLSLLEYTPVSINTCTSSQQPSKTASSSERLPRQSLGLNSVIPKHTDLYPNRHKLNNQPSITKGTNYPKNNLTTTLIAVAVTTVFIVSFLPHLCLMLARFLKPSLYDDLSDSGFVLYNIFVRSYLASSVLNPFIYGCLNRKFRYHCCMILRAILCYSYL
ncbi:hypothetical protein BsWGS_14150 [Bradybaena similaris]